MSVREQVRKNMIALQERADELGGSSRYIAGRLVYVERDFHGDYFEYHWYLDDVLLSRSQIEDLLSEDESPGAELEEGM